MRVSGLGLRVWGLGFRIQGLGFGVEGSGFRVQGSGLGPRPSSAGRASSFRPPFVPSETAHKEVCSVVSLKAQGV